MECSLSALRQEPGRGREVQSVDVSRAAHALHGQDAIGLDVEWRPCFQKGQKERVSILQVNLHHLQYLRLASYGMVFGRFSWSAVGQL